MLCMKKYAQKNEKRKEVIMQIPTDTHTPESDGLRTGLGIKYSSNWTEQEKRDAL